MLAIANVNQDIETALKQDKRGGGGGGGGAKGGHGPPWPHCSNTSACTCSMLVVIYIINA